MIDSAISWIEPTDEAKWNAIDALEDAGIDVSEEEFMELFNAWILSTCDNAVILGHTIKDTTREKVRPNYVGYGVTKDSKFSTSIRKIMEWGDNDPISAKWNRILRETFMDEGSESNGKYYIDLSRVKPRFDLSHTWFRCEHCSELTPYMLKGKCPNCQHESIHPMTDTATQQPLYSTLPDADDVVAIKGYSNTRMAVRPNQRIIMLNKGIGDKGFTICCDCGAAMPGDDPSVLKDIMRPYRSKFLRTRCKHNETKNVNLGYDFITDMLVLEIALDRQQVSMDLAKNSWLNRAGQSLAEALRLSACQELDIEFTELVTGFRVRQNQKGDFIDIYLYDSLSSGAGYAVSIEASIQQLLIKTRELLSSCNCDSACHKCLKHYRNQYVHGLLDRSAALDLLTWAEKGVRSPMLPVYEQRNLLQSVEQILQFSGVHIDFDHEPIEAESFHGKKRIVVYPAMWARPTEKNMVFVSDSYLKYAKPYALKTIVGGL